MKLFGIHIISNAKLNRIRDGVGQIDDHALDFIETQADRVVAGLKQTSIGVAVVNSISAIDNKEISGSEKFAIVLSTTAPLVLSYLNKGGIPALLDDVEDIARQLVQSIYNDLKSTGFGKIVKDLLRLLGL